MEIKFRNVTFKYDDMGKEILHNISFDVSGKDEFLFILGHTGSGKSTIVQNMNALLLPNSGQVEVYGKNVVSKVKHPFKLNTRKNRIKFNLDESKKLFAKSNICVYSNKLKDLRKHIGLVFQFPEYQLFESTVLKDVMFGPKNFGLNDEEAKKEAVKALKLVGLPDDCLEKSPFALSGGQMRRVAIAGILALNPDVIILDEPTVGLDPKGKDELMSILTGIQKNTHKSIIMISHDMNVVARYAKRVMVMENGYLVFDGSKRDLFENKEQLKEFNLDLPDIAKIAESLKDEGLINYKHLPLTKEELKTVILGGEINE